MVAKEKCQNRSDYYKRNGAIVLRFSEGKARVMKDLGKQVQDDLGVSQGRMSRVLNTSQPVKKSITVDCSFRENMQRQNLEQDLGPRVGGVERSSSRVVENDSQKLSGCISKVKVRNNCANGEGEGVELELGMTPCSSLDGYKTSIGKEPTCEQNRGSSTPKNSTIRDTFN